MPYDLVLMATILGATIGVVLGLAPFALYRRIRVAMLRNTLGALSDALLRQWEWRGLMQAQVEGARDEIQSSPPPPIHLSQYQHQQKTAEQLAELDIIAERLNVSLEEECALLSHHRHDIRAITGKIKMLRAHVGGKDFMGPKENTFYKPAAIGLVPALRRKRERGFVLPLTMMILAILTMMSLTMVAMSATEPQISANLADAHRVASVAESGIQYGVSQVVGTTFSAVANPLASNLPIPGSTAAFGTFTVTVSQPTTSTLKLTSVGSFGTASTLISATLKRGPDNPITGVNPLGLPAALTFQNAPISTNTINYQVACAGTNCSYIDGKDRQPGDSATTHTGTAPLLYSASSTNPIIGSAGPFGVDGVGPRSLTLWGRNSAGNYQQGNASIGFDPADATALSTLLANVALTIGTTNGPCALGTADLYCIGNATVGGSTITGSGILVVTGTLTVSGTLHWQGLIVAGAVVIAGGGDTLDVLGAVVLTNASGSNYVLDNSATGDLFVKYCSVCVQGALAGPGNTRVTSWRVN